jgi:hypothetical protein
MFKKLKEYGQAYAGALKTAYDPERLREEMGKAQDLKYAMPNASPERLPELVGLVPGPPVPAEAAAEQRRAAVAPSLAPTVTGATGAPPTIDRVFTRRPAADEIVTILSRTGLDGRSVLGVYPSSDLLHPARFGQSETWWEWCVVHTGGPGASEALAAAAAVPATERPAGPIVQVTEMSRFERWIDRDRNDPILFDEEAAAIVAVQSGVEPSQCLGLHRMLDWGGFGVDPNRMVGVMPVGARILRRPFVDRTVAAGADEPGGASSRLSAGAREWMARQAAAAEGTGPSAPTDPPMATLGEEAVGYAYGDPLPVQMDLLDFTTIALAVQPHWTNPSAATTAYPQLPGSAEELLLQHLLIVGLDPADTFGVATTVFEQQSAFLAPGAEHAERGACAGMLAIVYRDRPAYAEGRARFEQYRAQHLKVPLTIDRPVVGRAMQLAMKGMKWHVRSSIGNDAIYDEIGGDDSVDGDLYPYIVGPAPQRR